MSNPSSTAGVHYNPSGIRYAHTPGVQNPEFLNVSGSRDSHDTSRFSHISHDSHASTINLGGRDYNVGTRVGKSFIIGDPHANDPYASQTFDDLNVSKSAVSTSGASTTAASSKHMTPKDKYPVLEKAYNFEDWNWTVIRFLCFLMVIFVMLALLGAVIGFIIIGKTKCTSPFGWWQGSFTYHISVPHFSSLEETNNYGDLEGLRDKIAYFTYLGVQTVVLRNFLPSQEKNNRWDLVKSFSQIDERIGTIAQFIELVDELHDQGIKIVLQFETAYTSKLHGWYEDSRLHRPAYDSKYNNFYYWSEAELSGRNGSWALDERRLDYYKYLHNAEKPLLNWNSENVNKAFMDDLRIWLRRGVDGFILKGVQNIETNSLNTKLTIIKSWRELLDQFSKDDTDRKILCIDKAAIDDLQKSESGREIKDEVLEQVDVLDVPFSMNTRNTTYRLQGDVEEGLRWQRRPGGPWTQWTLTSLNPVEVSYRTALMLYLLMLPGNPTIVGGQEIGRNILEEQNPVRLLWRLESIFPYLPGSQLNQSTIAILRALSINRVESYSLREDGVIEDEDTVGIEATKRMSYSYPAIDKETLILRRQYKRRDAYYFAGNFAKNSVERDWFDVISGGDMLCDSHQKMSGGLSLAGDLTLERGQGIVFKVQY